MSQEEINLNVSQLDGVGSVTEKKLVAFGVKTILDICVRGSAEIAEITGVGRDKADQWSFNAQKILEDNNIIRKSDMDTVELMEYQENYPTLATCCKEVDGLMGGGVKPEATYEVYGEFGSGKTQFCNSLTVEEIGRAHV